MNNLSLIERLRAAVAAEKAPDGFIYEELEEALDQWDSFGGHLLVLTQNDEKIFFVALDRTPIPDNIASNIVEADPVVEKYDKHPSATHWINVDELG